MTYKFEPLPFLDPTDMLKSSKEQAAQYREKIMESMERMKETHMTLNKRWEEMISGNHEPVGHHSYIGDLGFIKDCPSLQEELNQQRHGHMNYETNLKDYSRDELVGLIKQMDISAKDVGKQIEYMKNKETNLRSALDAMYSKELLIKTALRDLFEYADLGLYNRDESMDDE